METDKFYHIFNRGNNRENIFKEEENYNYFLKRYEKYLSGVVDTYAYCLMPNHFHFLIRIKNSNVIAAPDFLEEKRALSPVEKAFKDFFISYAKSINKRYGRVGSLFQYKFKRKPVDNEDYLRRLVLYIHQNPVAAGYCEEPGDWKFSSYNSILKSAPAFLKREETISYFNDRDNFEFCHRVLTKTEQITELN